MDALIISDSHGRRGRIYALLNALPHIKYLFFCGDGLSDLSEIEREYPNIKVYAVKGNCDFFSFTDAEDELLIEVEGVRILMMHGHTRSVKSGLDAAAARAAALDAELLLFGHTHHPLEEYRTIGEKRVCLFNPGSLGYEGNFGTIVIKNKSFLVSHGTL